ncbi:MAG TPA: type III PLP-dependent enzyme [Trebonia sp.]|nr:type III PLP-dependent enzyme [Trebonia sp.]
MLKPAAALTSDELEVPEAVRALAEQLGREDAALPAYVYDLGGLDTHVAAIRAALPVGVEFCYAVKANPDPAVLRVVARHADSFEIASGGELAHVTAAVPGARLTFGGPGKTPAELAAAIRAGVARFHVESLHELRQLSAVAAAAGRTADVLLRVNLPPDETASASAGPASREGLVMGGGPTPFGMDLSHLDDCACWLTESTPETGPLRLRGLHAHLASGLDAGAALATASRIFGFARQWCAEHSVRNPEINLGGGMAVDYQKPGERFDWTAYGHGLAHAAAATGEILRIEPGRAVTAYCGWYVTRVLDVKPSYGKTFAVVAGGTHHLRTPAAKGHNQPFAVLPVEGWPHDWPRPAAPAGQVTLVGQLCTPKDVLARDVQVPALRAADLVAFAMAGAYAWNISHHNFLMHPPPSFHHIGAG